MIMNKEIFKMKPYLIDIDKLEPTSFVVKDHKETILTSLSVSSTAEAQHAEDINKEREEIKHELEENIYINYVTLERKSIELLMKAFQNTITLLINENKLWAELWLLLAMKHEEVAKEKVKTIEKPIVTTKTKEEKERFMKEKRKLMEVFFDEMYANINPEDELTLKEAKQTFIETEGEGDQIKEAILLEMMYEHETKKSKSNRKAKDKA